MSRFVWSQFEAEKLRNKELEAARAHGISDQKNGVDSSWQYRGDPEAGRWYRGEAYYGESGQL